MADDDAGKVDLDKKGKVLLKGTARIYLADSHSCCNEVFEASDEEQADETVKNQTDSSSKDRQVEIDATQKSSGYVLALQESRKLANDTIFLNRGSQDFSKHTILQSSAYSFCLFD